jgi:hypothetical protein
MAMATRLKAWLPALLALIVACGYTVWRLSTFGWNPIGLAELGTRFSQGGPTGSEGYDGQFTYYIAVDPDPRSVQEKLDVPAYRFQRILLPILGRFLGGFDPVGIAWAFLAINLVAHAIGTWAVAQFLLSYGYNPWFALIYGLWVGLVAGVGLHLHEPLAYSFVAVGFLARRKERYLLGACLLGLALFSKETALVFWGAVLLADILSRKRWSSVAGLVVGGLAFAGWQIWLWRVFGSPGLGSGGEMATAFEWLPFMGFFRIGLVSWSVLGLFFVIFGPTIILPTLWGVVTAARALVREWRRDEVWVLLLNSLAIVFLPFSTFREPLGLLRFASGLVLAVVIFAASRGMKKVLNYGILWIPLLAVLINR